MCKNAHNSSIFRELIEKSTINIVRVYEGSDMKDRL